VIKCFERSTVQRIEDNSKIFEQHVPLFMNTIMQMNTRKYGNGETLKNKRLIKRRSDGKDGSSIVFNIPLEKRREKKGGKNITTRGIQIWSAIQVLTPPSRA